MSVPQVTFLESVREACRQSGLCGVRMLVGVSGGADSVALLRALSSLQGDLQLTLVAGHLNHQLRGAESDADATWVQRLCEQLSIPCRIGSEAVAQRVELPALGLEGTARLARRTFLQKAASDEQCAAIALAHTANDQAETILHHILRGTGLAGLRGMHSPEIAFAIPEPEAVPRNHHIHAVTPEIPVVRPILHLERDAVERFLADLGQSYRSDSTNTDTTLTRNRIRHELLPLLKREFNPQIQTALLRLGQQAQEVYSYEAEQAETLLAAALLECTPRYCRLSCSPFAGHPPQRIREAFVRLWIRLNWPRRQMSFPQWNRLVDLVSHPTAAITLPGKITARRRDDLLMLARE